ncbi:hypothetical protein ACPW7J_02120 [Ihubacter sp. rT4E-8]|uniref:hypothetical protein n=1 Tax=Ihubacter sp. rT4E-8 TaxID=3242369 RepID=UPI003CF1D4D4
MSIPRAKKKKNPKPHRPTKTPFEIVKTTNYLNLAVMVRTLKTVYNWEDEQLAEFVEAYIALMGEVGITNTVGGLIRETKEMTGIDVKELLDAVERR